VNPHRSFVKSCSITPPTRFSLRQRDRNILKMLSQIRKHAF
jgi:hypothetical protein